MDDATNMNENAGNSTPVGNSIPVLLQIGGYNVFEGHLHLQDLKTVVALSDLSPSPSSPNSKSYPLTPDQAQQLLRKVDAKTAEFLAAIAQNGGEIKFARMQEIFEIEGWSDFSSRFGKGLTKALRHLTANTSAKLLFWKNSEWKTDVEPEAHVWVDGTALMSLRAAVGIKA